jgi:hypothetical protein
MQLEGEDFVVAAPGPAVRQIGDDRGHAILRDGLIIDDEVVENRHERDVDRIGRAFMDRGAAGTVPMIDPEYAALLFARERTGRGRQQTNHGDSKRSHAAHGSLPPAFRPHDGPLMAKDSMAGNAGNRHAMRACCHFGLICGSAVRQSGSTNIKRIACGCRHPSVRLFVGRCPLHRSPAGTAAVPTRPTAPSARWRRSSCCGPGVWPRRAPDRRRPPAWPR